VSAPAHLSLLWARVSDAAELAALHEQLVSPAWSVRSFEQMLAHPACTGLIARLGEPIRTAGFILGQLAADEAEILALCVRKDVQRQGIGRSLVEALGRAARKAEGRRLFLEVASDNAAALSLYGKLGFEQCGRRKGYYQRDRGQAQDAINLALTL
jgi:[ribosomal protein S18]-alanine N-acetyltransferase